MRDSSGDFHRRRILYHAFSGEESGQRAGFRHPARIAVTHPRIPARSEDPRRPVMEDKRAAPWMGGRGTLKSYESHRGNESRPLSSFAHRIDRIPERPLPIHVSSTQPRYSSVDGDSSAGDSRREQAVLGRGIRHDARQRRLPGPTERLKISSEPRTKELRDTSPD